MDQVKVGKFIESCRKKSNLTQEQLAQKLYVDRTLVSKWENGKLCPDIKYYQLLCEIFQVELKELITGERNNKYNKLKLNKNLIDFFEKQSNTIKLFKKTIIILFLIISIFLLYYFFETFNKTRVFNFYGNSEHYSINQGLLVLTREKSYFILNNNDIKSDTISIYYYKNNNKNIIYEGPNSNIIIDFTGYNSSINILNYKKIIDNIFLNINTGNNKETIHLNFEENYSNRKLFFKNDKEISEPTSEEQPADQTKTDDCQESICTFQEGKYQVIYDTVLQKIAITDNDNLYIDYFINTKAFNYSDNKTSFEIISDKIKCNKSNCSNANEIYQKFYNNYIKKYVKD